MNNTGSNTLPPPTDRGSFAATVPIPAVDVTTRDVVTRVTQSAQLSVERDLHKLQFRAMSTHCQVNCHGASAETVREFQREAVVWVAEF